ncbi:MAG: ThuA domain-containing protein [Planctomycetota bacterium]
MKRFVSTIACCVCAAVLLGSPIRAADIKADVALRIEKAVPEAAQVKPEKARKVLIYTRASGFVHASIPVGAKAFEILGKKTGAFDVTKITDDPAVFDADLSEFDAIVLMSTTGSFLRPSGPRAPKKEDVAKMSDDDKKKYEAAVKEFQAADKAVREAEPARRKALLNFVASGKGIVGIHAATDAYASDWPEYQELMGGVFNGHPWGKISVKIDDKTSPLTSQFKGENFEFSDEIYTYKTLPTHSREKLHVLLSIDLEESSKLKSPSIKKDATGKFSGENRQDHDYFVAWIKKYGNGRSFYTLLGHRDETYQNPLSMKFFLDGMQYALGDLKTDDSPSVKPGDAAPTAPAPAK